MDRLGHLLKLLYCLGLNLFILHRFQNKYLQIMQNSSRLCFLDNCTSVAPDVWEWQSHEVQDSNLWPVVTCTIWFYYTYAIYNKKKKILGENCWHVKTNHHYFPQLSCNISGLFTSETRYHFKQRRDYKMAYYPITWNYAINHK